MNKKAKCIFCGEEPKGKNKEHIIPKWLIKITGKESRNGYFGTKKNDGGPILPYINQNDFNTNNINNINIHHRVFSFSSLTFPACQKCNSEFSVLENKVKLTIEELLEKNQIDTKNIPSLLDWMDKIRVGIWLGNIQLDKNFFHVDPNFAIKKRMGALDRVLFIKRIKDIPDGINFIGTESFLFAKEPSVFCLRINEYLFYSISSILLISKEVGFPYYERAIQDNNSDGIQIELLKGLETLSTPFESIKTENVDLKIYQPIVPREMIEVHSEHYKNEYFKKNLIDKKMGKGEIFFDDGCGIRKAIDKKYFEFPECNHSSGILYLNLVAISILNWQSIVSNIYFSKLDLSLLNEDQKKYVNKLQEVKYKSNKLYIDAVIKDTIKKISSI